jgi:trans-aconitate 2-methyltransferase
VPEWAADRYDALPLPHVEWGRRLVSDLPLHGDETVVDVGCGTGRDLELLLARLPRGRAWGIDQSAAMVARARDRFHEEPRVEVLQGDLLADLPLPPASADVVISVAALHWVDDHRSAWEALAGLMSPGGLLSIECGGEGNVARVAAAVREVCGEGAVPSWMFPDEVDTAVLMERAGFVDVRVRRRHAPAVFDDEATFRRYLSTMVLHDIEPAAVDEVARRLGDLTIDYVRLEATALHE